MVKAHKRKTQYRQIPVRFDDFDKLISVKSFYEEYSGQRINWSDFFVNLATNYCFGIAMVFKGKYDLTIQPHPSSGKKLL